MNRNSFFNLMIGIILLLIVFSFSGCKKEKSTIEETSGIISVYEIDVSNKINVKVIERRIHDSSSVYSIETCHKDSNKTIDRFLLPLKSSFKQISSYSIDSPEIFRGKILIGIDQKMGKTKIIACNGDNGKISEITSKLDTKDPELLRDNFNGRGFSSYIDFLNGEIFIKIKEPNKGISIYKLNKDTQEF